MTGRPSLPGRAHGLAGRSLAGVVEYWDRSDLMGACVDLKYLGSASQARRPGGSDGCRGIMT